LYNYQKGYKVSKLHNFTNSGWGNNLENSGACWSINGAVGSGDFFLINNVWYKAIESKPCGDPKDMSFIKSYITLGELEKNEVASVSFLEKEYQKYYKNKTLHSFPLK